MHAIQKWFVSIRHVKPLPTSACFQTVPSPINAYKSKLSNSYAIARASGMFIYWIVCKSNLTKSGKIYGAWVQAVELMRSFYKVSYSTSASLLFYSLLFFWNFIENTSSKRRISCQNFIANYIAKKKFLTAHAQYIGILPGSTDVKLFTSSSTNI